MRALFVCMLLAACAPPSAVSPPRVDNLGLAKLSAEIDAGNRGPIAAVLVSQRGKIVFEDHFGATRPGDRVDMRSVGKSITALALGTANADGHLPDLEVSAVSFFPELAPPVHDTPAKKSITLRDLATMRSALDCDDWRKSPGNEERMYRRDHWTKFVLDLPTVKQDAGRSDQSRFAYCTAGVFLLGQVIERATGTSFDAYVHERLFDRIGVAGATWRKSPSSEVQSGGQLKLSLRDAERLGRLVLNRGRWGQEQVLPRAWIEEMVTPISSLPFGVGYGMLWWVMDLPVEKYGRQVSLELMTGNGGNLVAVVPEFDAVIVLQATAYDDKQALDSSLLLLSNDILPTLTAD